MVATLFGAGAAASSESAVAVLGPSPADKADSGVRGSVTFQQARASLAAPDGPSPVRVRVRVSGLAPLSKHGFHVHALGDLTKGCMSAGGHWTPGGAAHGGPAAPPDARHAGDLGNITADVSGNIDVEIEDVLLTLRGPLSIVGVRVRGRMRARARARFVRALSCVRRADALALPSPPCLPQRSVILHADEDDLGRGGFPDSKTTGHAGARIACGVIGIAEDAK